MKEHFEQDMQQDEVKNVEEHDEDKDYPYLRRILEEISLNDPE